MSTFSFRARDQIFNYADAIAQPINISCINDAPTAVADSGTGTAGIPVIIDVLANDTDPDSIYESQTFTINTYSTPTNGSLTVNANRLEYTPNGAFSGTEIFGYTLVDQSGAVSNTGNVTM